MNEKQARFVIHAKSILYIMVTEPYLLAGKEAALCQHALM
jgi:hypothetical protein